MGHKALIGLAIVMILMGALWIGQGLGIIKWPASSFMIGRPVWSWNGSALLLVGAAALKGGVPLPRSYLDTLDTNGRGASQHPFVPCEVETRAFKRGRLQ